MTSVGTQPRVTEPSSNSSDRLTPVLYYTKSRAFQKIAA